MMLSYLAIEITMNPSNSVVFAEKNCIISCEKITWCLCKGGIGIILLTFTLVTTCLYYLTAWKGDCICLFVKNYQTGDFDGSPWSELINSFINAMSFQEYSNRCFGCHLWICDLYFQYGKSHQCNLVSNLYHK